MKNPETIDIEACSPGPKMNANLGRIYSIIPSIGAWARKGEPGPLWSTAREAGQAILSYVGPAISPLVAESLHFTKEQLDFLGSPEALNAILSVVKEIYSGRSVLIDGLFPEEVIDAAPR
mgnify:CR=1 FL=1